ncbi:class I SAM-dependent methyltransferase [Amorphus sp. 3PC139-8]|uniref:class I SAM-dependent methyltransferase n=1 Tax=Amorphus sp. 3PC139-8 TaxID=2735676 RepID=UPI00345D3429
MSERSAFKPVDRETAGTLSAAEAIQYHYDNETRFFSLFLDKTLSYSAARFHVPNKAEPALDNLEDAQWAKIRFHLDALQLKPGARILDVGCGWGAILAAAVTEYEGRGAVGLTLSKDQRDYIESRDLKGVEVRLADVYEAELDGPYDGIVSVGAFEHFARPAMDKAQKIEAYTKFFEICHANLMPNALVSLQTIVWDTPTFEEAKKWIPETVFPQSDIPFIDEVVTASHPLFRLEYLENRREDYILTLDQWVKNLKAKKDEIVAEWDEEKYTFFEHYLRNSKLAFARRKNALSRFVLRRR